MCERLDPKSTDLNNADNEPDISLPQEPQTGLDELYDF